VGARTAGEVAPLRGRTARAWRGPAWVVNGLRSERLSTRQRLGAVRGLPERGGPATGYVARPRQPGHVGRSHPGSKVAPLGGRKARAERGRFGLFVPSDTKWPRCAVGKRGPSGATSSSPPTTRRWPRRATRTLVHSALTGIRRRLQRPPQGNGHRGWSGEVHRLRSRRRAFHPIHSYQQPAKRLPGLRPRRAPGPRPHGRLRSATERVHEPPYRWAGHEQAVDASLRASFLRGSRRRRRTRGDQHGRG
jgi:hypothetical protein